MSNLQNSHSWMFFTLGGTEEQQTQQRLSLLVKRLFSAASTFHLLPPLFFWNSRDEKDPFLSVFVSVLHAEASPAG